jgi:protein TonB
MLEDTMVEQKKFEPRLLEQTMLEPRMFGDSLLETSWAQRTRRGWTTLTSFGLEAVIIGLLLLLPLLKTVGLPSTRAISTPVTIGLRGAQPAAAPRPHTDHTTIVASNFDRGRLMMPRRIPISVPQGADEPSAPASDPYDGPYIPGARPGDTNGLPSPIAGGSAPLPMPKPAPISHPIRVSSILEGNLIRRVQPVYPPLARAARIQGAVVLVAIISKVGTIENLRVASGHPMLVPAAIDAVSQWRYRPYILNDEAVEVETQITVNFTTGGS